MTLAGCDSVRLQDGTRITMAWTETIRHECVWRDRRNASDRTDREWTLVAPFQPVPRRIGQTHWGSLLGAGMARETHCDALAPTPAFLGGCPLSGPWRPMRTGGRFPPGCVICHHTPHPCPPATAVWPPPPRRGRACHLQPFRPHP